MSFIREYEFIVGKPYNFFKSGNSLSESGTPISGTPFISTETGKAKILEKYFAVDEYNSMSFKDHQIEFSIEKNGGDSSDDNKAELTIYNMSDSSVNYMMNNAGNKMYATLKAGYRDDGIKIIFRGNVVKVFDKFEGPNRMTKFVLSDGGLALKEQLSSRSYPRGTKVDKIVEDLLLDVDLPLGSVAKLGDNVTIKHRMVFHGKTVDQLKRVLESRNYAFNIQDSFSYVIAKAQAEAKKDAESKKQGIVVLNSGSGLIGSPSYVDESASMTSKETKENSPNGIQFKSLLNGSLVPNGYVKIQSRTINGIFRITKVVHKGNYEGNAWFTECEAEDIGLSISQEDNEVTKNRGSGATGSWNVGATGSW